MNPNHRSFRTLISVLVAPLVLTLLVPLAWSQEFTASNLDQAVSTIWASRGISPSEPSTDAEFLRRVTLDLIGEPPSLEETLAFLNDSDPRKRTPWIHSLLARSEYGSFQARKWMQLIREGKVEKMKLPEESFRRYFETAFNQDRPFDQTVRELISAQGSSADNGATYLVMTHQGKQEDLVGTSARLFMGTQVQCAQCHDDKFGRWKQSDFWGMAAFFARLEIKPEKDARGKPVAVHVTDRPRGEAIIPEGGTPVELRSLPQEDRKEARMEMMMEMKSNPVEPSFLAQPVSLHPRDNRREAFARLVTSPENQLFAREQVNRVWASMFGRGLIEPVDDIYGKEAGDWEPVLAALSEEFVRSGHSLKHLYRLIANSKVYQLSSKGPEEDASDRAAAFAQADLRPLDPHTLLRTLLTTTGLETSALTMNARQGVERRKKQVLDRFEFLFGNDEGNQASDFEGTIPQALMMMNDEIISRGLAPMEGSTLVSIGQRTQDAGERVRLLYLATLCREPSPAEKEDCLAFLREKLSSTAAARVPDKHPQRTGNRRPQGEGAVQLAAYQDLAWALHNTTEYFYNH